MSGATIKNAWGDGRDASVCEAACEFRGCLRVGEDKGSFTPGRGYTLYYKDPRLVCFTRHLHGCPHPLPEPDPEKARCCPGPDLPKPRKGRKPWRQTCRVCRTHHSGLRLELVRTLPVHPVSKCTHQLKEPEHPRPGYWRCARCFRYWDHEPSPHEVGETLAQLHRREREELSPQNPQGVVEKA